MIPLATTELGTDSWITELMEPAVKEYGIQFSLDLGLHVRLSCLFYGFSRDQLHINLVR